MLRAIGDVDVAIKIERAIEAALSKGHATPDLGGTLSTDDFTEKLIENATQN